MLPSKLIKIVFIALLIINTPSYAGIEKLIKNVMPKGTMSNTSRGAIIKDQLSGHMIGGSVLIRSPSVDDMQFLNFQAPRCGIGGLPCAAQFDIRAGALSFVNAPAMMQFMKNLAQNAGAYGGIMAIKTICPQCEDIMTWLEGVQRFVNHNMNMNCNDMMNKVQGAFARMESAAHANRQSNLVLTGGGRDMAEIAEKSKNDSPDPTVNNEKLKGQLGENFNLVWKALEKKADNSGDGRSFKELLMSISGTIIIQKDNPPKYLASLVSKDLIEEYIGLKSGNATIGIYSCNEVNKCLSPQIIKTSIAARDTLYGQIDNLLTSIVNKIKNNSGAFTEEEENLIALSSLPIIKKIEIDLATFPDSAEASVRVAEFVEALCYDVITNHITRLLQQTTLAVNELSELQITDTGVFDKFNENASKTLRFISEAKTTAFRRYDIIAQTKARMRQEENYFEMKFEEYLSTNFKQG